MAADAATHVQEQERGQAGSSSERIVLTFKPKNDRRTQLALLVLADFASFFANCTSQSVTFNIADIQGGIGASADEISWLTVGYTAASACGILVSGPLIRTLGIRRFVAAAAFMFASAALIALQSPAFLPIIVTRLVQGLAAGGLGPVAFMATFTVMAGKRLPLGLLVLTLVLLMPGTVGPVLSAWIQDRIGWQALYFLQFSIALVIGASVLVCLPAIPLANGNLRADWVAIFLLSVCICALTVVLGQGTRYFWFSNEVILQAAIICVAAGAGFAISGLLSPRPVISLRLLASRRFGLPILLNLVFRASFAVTGYLVPQSLAVTQGYRPRELADLICVGFVTQVAALPLVWILARKFDLRVGLGIGIALCAVGSYAGAESTSLTSGRELFWLMLLFCAGQIFFLSSNLFIGALSLDPPDLPTASISFNLTTLLGTTLGIGLVSHFVTEREKFHSGVLTEGLSRFDSRVAERIAGLVNSLSSRVDDEIRATNQAMQVLAASARKQAWILASDDGYILVAAVLLVSVLMILAIPRARPIRDLIQDPSK